MEPFYGGSHRSFADGLVAASRHTIHLSTLPARFWKWRMRGAALHFARQIRDPGGYDGVLASGLMSLADFKALTGGRCPPTLVYFHETQLTYPLAPGERFDRQYGFTDIASALAADRVMFNSHSHRDAFFANLPVFLRQMPEYRPLWAVDAIRAKACVLHPGCRFEAGPPGPSSRDDGPPVIVWNHRWEFDKQPEVFLEALESVAARGLPFRLTLLGERFRSVPPAFDALRRRFAAHIVHDGFEPTRAGYYARLRRASVVVSTAAQENFGMAVVEAVRCGCFPLLPDRLSYPEIIPRERHADCLYRDPADLARKLAHLLENLAAVAAPRAELARAMDAFAWESRIEAFDRELDALATASGRPLFD